MGIHSDQVRDEIGGVGVLIVARFSTWFLQTFNLANILTSRQFIAECETTAVRRLQTLSAPSKCSCRTGLESDIILLL